MAFLPCCLLEVIDERIVAALGRLIIQDLVLGVVVAPTAARRGTLPEPQRRDAALAAVTDWYRAHARARLPERVALWSAKLGVEPSDVLVREQRKRWASCDEHGVLRFNWRVIQAPMRLVDYVVAHELVHLRHRDHAKAFWARLGTAMPDYEKRREELRRLGPRLQWRAS